MNTDINHSGHWNLNSLKLFGHHTSTDVFLNDIPNITRYRLTDWTDYMEIDSKNNVLIIHPKHIRNDGTFITTDIEYAKIHPKTMDEFLMKNKERIKQIYKVSKIRRLDKQK